MSGVTGVWSFFALLQVRCCLRKELDVAQVFDLEPRTDDVPRKMWAAECWGLDDVLPKEGQVHDGLLITNGTEAARGIVSDTPFEDLYETYKAMLCLHEYDPSAMAREAQRTALQQLQERMDRNREQRDNARMARLERLKNAPTFSDEEEDPVAAFGGLSALDASATVDAGAAQARGGGSDTDGIAVWQESATAAPDTT